MNRSVCMALLVSAFSCIYAPALASEAWNCTVAELSGPGKGIPGSVRIQIDGNMLNWLSLVPKIPLNPDAGTKWVTFHNRVLENNDVGIVAVFSESRVDRDVGTVIGALIITLNKSSGALRTGSAGARACMIFQAATASEGRVERSNLSCVA